MKVFICYFPLRPFHVIASNIQYVLANNGIPSVMKNQIPVSVDTEDNLFIIIWNGIAQYPKNCIIFNFDPMSADHVRAQFTSQLDNSPNTKIRAFIDYCRGQNETIVRAIMEANVAKFPDQNYLQIPYGYSTFHERIFRKHQPEQVKKDIDVLYYGGSNDRRGPIVAQISEYCRSIGKVFVHRDQNLYEEGEKASVVNRSKIVISIASQDALKSATNDLARLAYLISNKAFIICERIGDTLVEPVIQDYVTLADGPDDLIKLIQHYLLSDDADQEREDVCNRAYERFKEDFDYEKGVMDVVNKFYIRQ